MMHVVWDWNGTLLDDLPIVIEAANVSLSRHGVAPIDEQTYRDHFTRPIRRFYDHLFGRPVSDGEWQSLNDGYHHEYYALVEKAPLTGDALQALDRVDGVPWTQSLLSMSTHDTLLGVLEAKEVFDRFARIDGLRGETGGLKEEHLRVHLEVQGIDPRHAIVVGDTPDDYSAARGVGANPILYDGGSHHLHVLESLDAPVAGTLLQALDMADEMAGGP